MGENECEIFVNFQTAFFDPASQPFLIEKGMPPFRSIPVRGFGSVAAAAACGNAAATAAAGVVVHTEQEKDQKNDDPAVVIENIA